MRRNVFWLCVIFVAGLVSFAVLSAEYFDNQSLVFDSELNNSHVNEAYQNPEGKFICPPFAIIAKSTLTSVTLSFANQPGSAVEIAGVFVYYLRAGEDFDKVKLASKQLITTQIYETKNLLPATNYTFVLRSATKNKLDDAEMLGEYFLSRFSDEIDVKTAADSKIELIRGNINGGIFKVSRYNLSSQSWISERFYCKPDEQIGEVKNIEGQEIDFRTNFVLKNIKEAPAKLEKFEDKVFKSKDIEIKIPFPPSKSDRMSLRARLISKAGEEFFVYQNS